MRLPCGSERTPLTPVHEKCLMTSSKSESLAQIPFGFQFRRDVSLE